MYQTLLNRTRKVRENEGGFTLIELLIVIVILGILAAIVVFSVRGITDRGDVAACKSNVATSETAVEAYYAKEGSYPNTLADLVTANLLKSDPSAASGAGAVDPKIRVGYDGAGNVTPGTSCD